MAIRNQSTDDVHHKIGSFPPKQNGTMPDGLERPRRFTLAQLFQQTAPTMMVRMKTMEPMALAAEVNIAGLQRLFVNLRARMPGDSMTCMAMSSNGAKTIGMTPMKEPPPMAALGYQRMKMQPELSAAAPGTLIQGAAPPTASTSAPMTATTISVFV